MSTYVFDFWVHVLRSQKRSLLTSQNVNLLKRLWLLRMSLLSCLLTSIAHSYEWYDSATCVCVTWLIHMRDMTHPYVWHDSFIWVIRLIRMCDMTHSHHFSRVESEVRWSFSEAKRDEERCDISLDVLKSQKTSLLTHMNDISLVSYGTSSFLEVGFRPRVFVWFCTIISNTTAHLEDISLDSYGWHLSCLIRITSLLSHVSCQDSYEWHLSCLVSLVKTRMDDISLVSYKSHLCWQVSCQDSYKWILSCLIWMASLLSHVSCQDSYEWHLSCLMSLFKTHMDDISLVSCLFSRLIWMTSLLSHVSCQDSYGWHLSCLMSLFKTHMNDISLVSYEWHLSCLMSLVKTHMDDISLVSFHLSRLVWMTSFLSHTNHIFLDISLTKSVSWQESHHSYEWERHLYEWERDSYEWETHSYAWERDHIHMNERDIIHTNQRMFVRWITSLPVSFHMCWSLLWVFFHMCRSLLTARRSLLTSLLSRHLSRVFHMRQETHHSKTFTQWCLCHSYESRETSFKESWLIHMIQKRHHSYWSKEPPPPPGGFPI